VQGRSDGSPCYIAPEIAVGEPIDARADLYSLGIVVFEMLTGDVPFEHADTTTILRMHITAPLPPLRIESPDGTPTADVEAFVQRALAKEPTQRFPTAIAMHAAVTQIVPPLRPPAPRARKLDRARHVAREAIALARRRPAIFAAAATALVVAILLIAIVASSSSDDADKLVTETPKKNPKNDPVAATPIPATQWVQQAESEVARRRYTRAIAAYERALATDRTLAKTRS
jgi:serine/threonine protein kinase